MRVRFEVATAAHARIVATNMRESDVAEVRAGWGCEPEEAILHALMQSPRYARTVFVGLEPLAIYGLAALTLLGASAEAWCFGTTAIDRHRFAFARASRVALAVMYRHSPILTNMVAVGDERAVRWITWLGAKYPETGWEKRSDRWFAQFVLSSRAEAECHQG